ncbi:XRE family transcriptional regulator [Achromobacter denitrificans]
MSDTALKNARMSDALEQSLIREAIDAQALAGPNGSGGWRRLKLRLAAWGGAVGEVLHDMDAGRRQHPVVSAYH